MEQKQSGTGSSLVAAGLAFSLVVLTFSTIYFFLKRTWWFPEPISAFAESIDRQFGRTLFITGVVFFLAQLALGYVIFRYRDRGGRAHYSHGNTMLEILWTSATAVMFIGLGLAAERAWASLYWMGAAPGAMQGEVTGKQFVWSFCYPGVDGQFVGNAPSPGTGGAGHPVGLDTSDPAAQGGMARPPLAVPGN